ncbi:hypothetical protein M406DRAFT_329406 [Cryphonectria parasitica EP155]|uniref:Uncharacterized protein n=1 Tax=Cryphonectria parasitica (strain ATCC 38755 / EP155) TaxID=660469 RepID=A0A9P5CPZ7_CRYP1|nr:uncharacterized protein M406DRAFT_329406 [Cryphonectria parasitica EP155]KAF3765500.1 hypothetical protein M406DRAFT_329406 [Cryphonectria parasitica EP155]
MDKKKKNGAAGSSSTEGKDKDRPSEGDASTPRPVKATPLRPSNNGERSKASATPGSDRDSSSTTTKAQTHTPDDTTRQGPQKKRRKVTHACVYCRRSAIGYRPRGGGAHIVARAESDSTAWLPNVPRT